MVRQVTIVLGLFLGVVTMQARKSNGTANKHTAMGFRRGRGIHNEAKRLPLAERADTVYKPGCGSLAMASYLVLPVTGSYSAKCR